MAIEFNRYIRGKTLDLHELDNVDTTELLDKKWKSKCLILVGTVLTMNMKKNYTRLFQDLVIPLLVSG